MKMKFPDGVTHHYDETGARNEVTADSTIDVPEHRVPEYLAAGYTKAEEAPVVQVEQEPEVEPQPDAEKAQALEAAQLAVDEAQAAVNAASEETKAAAEQALAEAQAALVALTQ